jgi:hypothetical protein
MIEISYSNGHVVTAATLADAIAHVTAAYPEAVFYRKAGWDVVCVEAVEEQALQREGARLLAWAREAESRPEDGARAVASLRWHA